MIKHKVDILGLLSLVALGIFVLICISPPVARQGYEKPTPTLPPSSTPAPSLTPTLIPTVIANPVPVTTNTPSITPSPIEGDELYGAEVNEALKDYYSRKPDYDVESINVGLIEHTDAYTEKVVLAIFKELAITEMIQVTLSIEYSCDGSRATALPVLFLGRVGDEWVILSDFDKIKR